MKKYPHLSAVEIGIISMAIWLGIFLAVHLLIWIIPASFPNTPPLSEANNYWNHVHQ